MHGNHVSHVFPFKMKELETNCWRKIWLKFFVVAQNQPHTHTHKLNFNFCTSTVVRTYSSLFFLVFFLSFSLYLSQTSVDTLGFITFFFFSNFISFGLRVFTFAIPNEEFSYAVWHLTFVVAVVVIPAQSIIHKLVCVTLVFPLSVHSPHQIYLLWLSDLNSIAYRIFRLNLSKLMR